MTKIEKAHDVLKSMVHRIGDNPDSIPVAYTRDYYKTQLLHQLHTLLIASRLTVWQVKLISEMLRMAYTTGTFDGLPPLHNPLDTFKPDLPEIPPEYGGEG